MLVLAQASGDPRGLLAFLLVAAFRFLVVVTFYAVTLHLAATFFLGDVRSQRAAYVALAPAAISVILGQFGLAGTSVISPGIDLLIAVAMTLVADGMAIVYVYGLGRRPAAALTLLHFAFATILGFALNNIFGFVG
ncbi:MAG: hypothetical protein ACI8XM_001144 [Haloarculaceae archaeon]|jgi:hypothetical protein